MESAGLTGLKLEAAILTTEPNDVLRPVHEKAMPVILVDPAEQNEWLEGGEASFRLQRPLSSEMLRIKP